MSPTSTKARPKPPAQPVLIDPRLRDRRIEVARGAGRKRLRRLAIVGTVLVLVALGAAATQSPLLDVDRLVVRGSERTDADAVRSASGVALGDPLVSLDLGAATRRLEALPWVADARVSRSWGGAVTIALTERVAVAEVGTGGAAVLVDADGRVLAEAEPGDALPRVAGRAPGVGSRLDDDRATAVAVVGGLEPELRAEVASVAAPDGIVTLTLVDDIEVTWGPDIDRSAKAASLQILLEQADRATMASIDVTVPGSAAVTRKTVEE